MGRQTSFRHSQRGAALVEAALTIALVGVVAIQSLSQFGKGTADKLCSDAGHVTNADHQFNPSTEYYYDKDASLCCAGSPLAPEGGGRGGSVNGGGRICLSS